MILGSVFRSYPVTVNQTKKPGHAASTNRIPDKEELCTTKEVYFVRNIFFLVRKFYGFVEEQRLQPIFLHVFSGAISRQLG